MTETTTSATDVKAMLRLALPVIAGQLGIMSMGLVDTAMVRSLGPEAIAAVGVGGAAYAVSFTVGLGMLLGLDRVVSVAVGAGRTQDAKAALVQALWIATGMSVVATAGMLIAAENLGRIGVDPAVVPLARDYLRVLAISVWPALVFSALRQTLQSMGDVRAASIILVVANIVNAVANWLLIHGELGAPKLGVPGSAWATVSARIFMVVAISAWAWKRGFGGAPVSWRPGGQPFAALVTLGVPAALHMLAEVGVFALATMLVARLGAVPAAAHHVVLQIASFTFMVPLGLSSAGAVLVGQAAGRGDPAGARRAGWTAVGIAVGFMAVSAVVLIVAWRLILAPFTTDPEVIALARQLLLCAGVFQLFDGAQVALGGVLRGAGNTMAAFVTNLAGHWLVGLPIGAFCAYHLELGAVGLWIGLATGLAVVGVALALVWSRVSQRIVAPYEEDLPTAA